MTYQDLKDWWDNRENKNKVMIAASFVVIFFVGFGTGKYEKGFKRDNYQLPNYTTSANEKQTILPDGGEGAVAGAQTGAANLPGDCPIKGNIGSAGKKIYHVKGGAFYDRTKAEQCFNTEKEAVAAGFVKSSR